MVIDKSIILDIHYERFIDSTISKGKYKNISEVIRAGLELLELEENKIIQLNNAINEGLNSGLVIEFDSKKHLETLKATQNV